MPWDRLHNEGHSVNMKIILRWLERVSKCYKPFETRKDYKEVFMSMWANYEYLDNSLAEQYFKAVCDVIAVTMTFTLKVHKKKPQISVFVNYPKNWVGDLTFLLHF